MSSTERDFYAKRLASKTKDLDAVQANLETSKTTEEERKLMTRAEQLLEEIKDLDAKISGCDLSNDKPIVQMVTLDKTLRKVDFQQAKIIASDLKRVFDEEQTMAVLLLLERMTNQMGDYCLDEMLSIVFECVVKTDSFNSKEVNPPYRSYLVDLSDVTQEASEIIFLQKLESYHGNSLLTDSLDLHQAFRKSFCQALRSGDRVVIIIKNWQYAVNYKDFFSWFIEDFWKKLVDDMQQSVLPKYGRIRFVTVLASGGDIPNDCLTNLPFNSINPFNVYHPIKIPLSNWTADDIRRWLMDVKKLERDVSEIQAQRIYSESDGIPRSICSQIKEKYST